MLNFHKFQSNIRQGIRDGIADGSSAYVGPEHVVIDLTNRCSNSCIACWTRSPLLKKNAPEPSWHKQELDSDRVLKLIDELHQMGTSIIRFTGGGEPFMHDAIYDLIRAVKTRGIYCAVTTNMNAINMDAADELISIGLDELSVSLWASDPEEYVRTHPNQKDSAFIQITEVLRHINDCKRKKRFSSLLRWFKPSVPRVSILNVICNLNYQSIEAMFDYALNVGAESIYFTLVDTIEGSTDTLLLTDSQRENIYRSCKAIQKKNKRLPRHRRIFLDNFSGFMTRLKQDPARHGLYDQNLVDSIPCYIGWVFCRIMADGQVAPCCRGVQIKMGSIYDSSFSEIWHSNKYNHFRRIAKTRSKKDRYFSKVGCQKTCDNYMHNLEIHNWLGAQQ